MWRSGRMVERRPSDTKVWGMSGGGVEDLFVWNMALSSEAISLKMLISICFEGF